MLPGILMGRMPLVECADFGVESLPGAKPIPSSPGSAPGP
jgi:hypothetical protein